MKRIGFIVCLSFSFFTLHAQWQRTGPYGGVVTYLGVSDSLLMTGSNRSPDYGQYWSSSGLENVRCLDKQGTRLFAATDYRILISDDNGLTWDTASINTSYGMVSDVLVKDSLVFASIYHAGIFVSADSGQTWTDVNAGLPELIISCLARSGNYLFAGTNNYGVVRSADNGATWEVLNNGLSHPWILDIIEGTFYLITCDGFGVLCKSADNGNTWQVFYESTNAKARSVAFCNDRYYVGTSLGVYYRTVYNSTWHQLNTGLASTSIHCFAVSGNDLFAGTSGGVHLMRDTATEWLALNNGIYSYNCRSLCTTWNDIFAGTGMGCYRTGDYSQTWNPAGSGLFAPPDAFAVRGSDVFAGAKANNYESNVYKSTDLGATWTALLPSNIHGAVNEILVDQDNIYAAADSGLFISKNDGQTWIVAGGQIIGHNTKAIAKYQDTIYVGTNSHWIFSTTDSYNTWTQRSANFDILALAFADTVMYAGGQNGIFRSYDYGHTWTQVHAGTSWQTRHTHVLKVIGQYIFAGKPGGFFYSKNGTDWYADNGGLINLAVSAIETDQVNLYIGTGNGIFKRPLSDFDMQHVNTNDRTTDLLVFPNPATSTLYFSNNENANVEILNLQGQVIYTKTLLGKNESVDVSGLPNGVYVVRLKMERGVINQKIVIE